MSEFFEDPFLSEDDEGGSTVESTVESAAEAPMIGETAEPGSIDLGDTQLVAISTWVDVVFAIDATGSMSPIIDEVKQNILGLHQRLITELKKYKRKVDKVRVKVIAFRDYYYDEEPMVNSRFYELPDEEGEFKRFVDGIEAAGGGDEPENALEALHLAIVSDWAAPTSKSVKSRQIIMMMTDAPAHPLDSPKRAEDAKRQYPAGIPKDLKDLQEEWDAPPQSSKMISRAQRLIVLAPNAYPWSKIGTEWNQTILTPSSAGNGLTEISMDMIITYIAKSI